MIRPGCWVALEGPCCAGKTTLGRELLRLLDDLSVSYVPCYAEHVGGGRFLPPPVPHSLTEDQAALRTLLAVEFDRTAGARAQPHDVVLLDRSVYTLLAHRYALEHLVELALCIPARQFLTQSDIPCWPDLVLYLDLPQKAIPNRNNGKFASGNILIDPRYNAGVRSFFERLAESGGQKVAWLDATLHLVWLRTLAEKQIRALLAIGHPKEY